jgi:predicted nucleotidyltransferase
MQAASAVLRFKRAPCLQAGRAVEHNMINPTPYSDVNAILTELLAGVQRVFGGHLVGMYLDGSLANGDFDEASDIDFVVVSDEEITGDQFAALYALHEQIAAGVSPWAIQLEGSYLSQHAVRRYNPAYIRYPNLERGEGERLKWALHDESWVTHRYILRNRGITVLGPLPQTLIDPITPDDLQQGMAVVLQGWATQLLKESTPMASPGYQAYIVLSLCRIFYTLRHGDVVSKAVAAQWAIEQLDARWIGLIKHALRTRLSGAWDATPNPVQETCAFIRYALEQSQPVFNPQEKNV